MSDCVISPSDKKTLELTKVILHLCNNEKFSTIYSSILSIIIHLFKDESEEEFLKTAEFFKNLLIKYHKERTEEMGKNKSDGVT